MITCCTCKKQYEFAPFKGALELPVLICPHCGIRHTVEFKATIDSSRTQPIEELRLTSAQPVLIASRFATSGRVALGASDNINITINKSTYPEIIISFLIDEEKGPWTATYRCNWKNTTDTGSFAPIAASGGEINWGSSTDLTNGGTVVVGERITTTSLPSGSTWEDQPGEVEGASTSSSFALADEKSTEVQVALSLVSAKEGKLYTFQIYDATGGSAIGTATATLTITSDQPSVVLNTAEAYEFTTDRPTLEFTGTDASDSDIRYNIQIDTVATFDSLIDSYSEINQTNFDILRSGWHTKDAQSFTGNGDAIVACRFWANKVGSPTGNIVACVYDHSGVFGESSVPTGVALATSNTFDSSSLKTVVEYITLIFPSPFTTVNGTKYCISIEFSGGSAGNSVNISYDSSGNHAGNYSYYYGTSWSFVAASDFIFEVLSDIPLLNKNSLYDLGFANTVTPADTDPFNSGEKCDYDVQVGEELADDTYYWRVRGMDPWPGSGSYGSWPAAKSFIVATTQNTELVVADATSAITSGTPTLTQVHALAVNAAASAVSSGSPVLIEHKTLSVADSANAMTSETPTLSQSSLLVVADAAHALASGEPILNQVHNLAVANAASAMTSENAVLTEHKTLEIADSVSAVISDIPALTENKTMEVANAASAIVSDNITLIEHKTLAVDASAHALVSDNPILTEHKTLTIDDSAHAVDSDNIALAQGFTLGIQNSAHDMASDSLTLTQLISLVVAAGVHLVSSNNVVLVPGSIAYLIASFTEAETGDEYYLINDRFISKEGGGRKVSFPSLPAIMFEAETGDPFLVLNQNIVTHMRGIPDEY